eukprot:638649-Prorocentrum_minimum.AAC.1
MTLSWPRAGGNEAARGGAEQREGRARAYGGRDGRDHCAVIVEVASDASKWCAGEHLRILRRLVKRTF